MITSPTGTYALGQTVPATYSCADTGSGIATCAGTVPNGANYNTASEGTTNFAVTATDAVGNRADAMVTYGVVSASAYAFRGFFDPIDMSTPTPDLCGIASRQRCTVPVKWLLTENETPVSSPSSFLGLSLYRIACTSGACFLPKPAIDEVATGNGGLQYSGSGHWQFNWQTPSSWYKNTCRAVVARFSDGTTSPIANFKFK